MPVSIALPLGLSYPTVNAYLFPGPAPALVDCGLNRPDSQRALQKALRQHGLGFGDLKTVVITHPHVDHIGLAGVLAAAGAEIWLSDLAHDWMVHLAEHRGLLSALHLGLLRRTGFDETIIRQTGIFYERLAPLFSPLPPASLRIFTAGEAIDIGGRPWEVLPAPGHSNRQVCFFQPESRELLSADMLLPKAPVPVIEPDLQDPSVRSIGLPDLLTSYSRLRELHASRVYPGHGAPIDDARTLIDQQAARIRRRIEECRLLIASGVTSLPALLDAMYSALPRPQRQGALGMLVGYLDVLVAEGRVRAEETIDGRLEYLPAP